MSELQWTPRQLGELTLDQLACLVQEKPPGDDDGLMSTAAQWLEFVDARKREDAEWLSS